MLASKARSSQIATAAQLLAASWIASLALWRWVGPELRNFGLAGVDLVLAGEFYAMSRGRWFPAPLFFLHAGLVLYYLFASSIGSAYGWVAAVANRAFELEAIYIAGCAAFRIGRLARQDEGAR